MALTVEQMKAMPMNTFRVEMTTDNPVYQEFLAANRAIEDARETYGYVPPEFHERFLASVRAVSAEAARLYAQTRARE